MATTPLILVSERLTDATSYTTEVHENSVPRRDYFMLAERIGASLRGYQPPVSPPARWVHRLERQFKFDLVNPITLRKQIDNHNVVISMSEKSAIPWGTLRNFTRIANPHVVVAHKLSTGAKSHLWRMLPAPAMMTHVVCVCREQADYAVKSLGMPSANVKTILHHVDNQFFQPQGLAEGDYVLAVGSEQRDFVSLIRAMEGTAIKLIIVVNKTIAAELNALDHEANLRVLSNIPFVELRALYEQARVVVAPLHNVDYAAGSTSILEAMAMGRPVVVSRTRGIEDYVVEDITGVYVAPYNVLELRDKICDLYAGPATMRNTIGDNARQAVAESMNSDYYIDQLVALLDTVNQSSNTPVSQL